MRRFCRGGTASSGILAHGVDRRLVDRAAARGTESPRRRSDPDTAHNTEAEQALLGAILVNNRPIAGSPNSSQPEHFGNAVHGRIYRRDRQADRARPDRQPGHAEEPVRPGRRARRDRRRAVSRPPRRRGGDDHQCRGLRPHASTTCTCGAQLIGLGEDVVNDAFHQDLDDPRDRADRARRGEALRARQRPARPRAASAPFNAALTERDRQSPRRPSSAAARPSASRPALSISTSKLGGLHPSDLIILAGRPSMGKTALATNIAFNAAQGLSRRRRPRRRARSPRTARCRLLFAGNVGRAARHPHPRRGVAASPPTASAAARSAARISTSSSQASQRLAAVPLYIDDTPALSVAALRTRARRLKRQQGLGLIVIDYLQLLRAERRRAAAGEPRAGNLRDHPRPQGASPRSSTCRCWRCRSCRARSSSARTSARSSPICANPARSSRTPTSSCSSSARNIICRAPSRPAGRTRATSKFNDRHERWQRALRADVRPRRGHHRQAAPRPDRHGEAAFRGRDHQVRQFHRPRNTCRRAITERSERRCVRPPPRAPAPFLRSTSAPIVANWRLLASRAAPAACAAVVKADAYGLGAAPVARALAAAGCRRFFVATLDEGIALRAALGDEPEIAVFNGPLPGSAAEFVAARLIPVLNDPGQIDAWRRQTRRRLRCSTSIPASTGSACRRRNSPPLRRIAGADRRAGRADIDQPPRLRRRPRRIRSTRPSATALPRRGAPARACRRASPPRPASFSAPISISTWSGPAPRSTASTRCPAAPTRCARWCG